MRIATSWRALRVAFTSSWPRKSPSSPWISPRRNSSPTPLNGVTRPPRLSGPTSWSKATYETGAQEHVYIEPQGMLAGRARRAASPSAGSLQCPYYVHRRASPRCSGCPPEKVRVIQTATGGGFGGKEEYPSMIAGHAALLAWKSGRPVKLVYDRIEDMWATTKRHPSRIAPPRRASTRDGRSRRWTSESSWTAAPTSRSRPVVLVARR